MSKNSLLFESVKSKFDTLANADNTLDQKAGTLMGFEIALITGYLTLAFNGLQGVKLIEGISGIVILIISTILLLIIIWPRDYSSIIVDLSSNESYLSKKEQNLLLQLISDTQNACKNNKKNLDYKAKLFKISITLLLVSSTLLSLSKLEQFYI
ncbi:MAG TPA: hypothetical protein PLA19_04995 [Candidatus Pacearchaeota archaeon]|nr:hypothetical protein [Candidatus Pacearchaeota archaeon]